MHNKVLAIWRLSERALADKIRFDWEGARSGDGVLSEVEWGWQMTDSPTMMAFAFWVFTSHSAIIYIFDYVYAIVNENNSMSVKGILTRKRAGTIDFREAEALNCREEGSSIDWPGLRA